MQGVLYTPTNGEASLVKLYVGDLDENEFRAVVLCCFLRGMYKTIHGWRMDLAIWWYRRNGV